MYKINTKEQNRSEILELLRQKGCRITEQRKNLIEIILDGNCSSCKEIYFEVNKAGGKIGMATIYRMMNLLEEIGALKWRGEYCFCDQKALTLRECRVELEGADVVELKEEDLREIFEHGMKECGYSGGEKVRYILALSNEE